MACFKPLKGWRARTIGPSGKRAIVFNQSEGWADLPATVPCGQCVGCRLERSRQWAMRCMHEASLHEDNAFITLTYNDEHLPAFNSLDKKAFPKFMKRIRRRLDDKKIRYYHCGEYGDETKRPHYHACLFGYDFADKYHWSVRNDQEVWRSDFLEELWPFGNSEIGTVTFESAAYVARYIMKKVTGFAAQDHYQAVDLTSGEIAYKQPEYTTMSRRPGIGKGWYDRWKDDVYPSDQVIVRGKAMKPPKYYDSQYELADPAQAAEVWEKRKKKRSLKDETPRRLRDREICTTKRVNLFPREVTER